jgi:hypothetical protein
MGNSRVRLKRDELEYLKQYRRIKAAALQQTEDPELSGDNLTLTSRIAQSVEDIVKEYNIDLSLWECVGFNPGNWTTPVKVKFRLEDSENGVLKERINATMPLIIENRKSTAIFKRKTQIIDYERFRRELTEDVKSYSPKVSIREYDDNNQSGNLLEINIPDLHLGKQAWAEETGFMNYDIKIAVQRFEDSLDDMLSRAVAQNHIERILFIVGNDLFNSDGNYPYAATTGGTPMEDDARWQKVFRTGRQMIIRSILKLRQLAPVDVKVIPGNHDFQKAFYLGEVLEARFEGDENVTIDNSPKTRKYYKWGRCLLGFAHGNKIDESEARLINNMKHECAREWGDTIYREWHCGDIHHYKEMRQKGTSCDLNKYCEDIDGVIIKYLRTLMFNDEWEAKKGFISQKGAHLFVWNKEDGNTIEYKYNKY